MNAEPTLNPYRAPAPHAEGSSREPTPAEFIPDRLTFRGTLTVEHHRRAVTGAGIRTDYRTGLKVVAALAVLVLALLPLVTLLGGGPVGGVGGAIVSVALVALGVGLFHFNHRQLVAKQLPGFQFVRGHVEGRIDAQEFQLGATDYRVICPLNQLVASAWDSQVWALCFHQTYTFWQTLPLDAFDDPRQAAAVADALKRLRPPGKPELADARAREPVTWAPRFPRAAEAIDYEGFFHEDEAAGTRLAEASRRFARRSWLSLGVLFLCVVVGVSGIVGLEPQYLALFVVWCLLVIGGVMWRIASARRRARREGRTVVWWSRGWLDADGYCSITALGQCLCRYAFFDHHEITDQAIVLYPHASDACGCLIGRGQFASEEDWHAARDLVRRSMPPA